MVDSIFGLYLQNNCTDETFLDSCCRVGLVLAAVDMCPCVTSL